MINIHAVLGEDPDKVGEKGPGKRRSLPFVEDKSFDAVNAIRNTYNLSWDDFFNRLHLYEYGLHYIFQAPKVLTKAMILDHNTCMGLITQWVMNSSKNMTNPNAPPDIKKLKEKLQPKGKAAVCIAAGPSMVKYDHLRLLHDSGFDGLIFCAAHALKATLDAGVIPDVCVVVDGNGDKIPAFFDHDIVRKHAPNINLVACMSVHPKTLDMWGHHNVYFFRTGVPFDLIPNVDTLLAVMYSTYTELDSGGNNGAALYSVASWLGCPEVAFIGLDLGYYKDFPYEDTMYFNAYSGSIGTAYKDVNDMISRCYEDVHHPIFDTDCYIDFVYATFRDAVLNMAKVYKEHFKSQLVNCTGGGTIFGDEIICKPFSEFLEEHKKP